jgi:hypothetical protein
MEIIRTTYAYNYKHNKVSLKVILAELAKAHLVRTLKDAPPPGTAMANLVADTIKQLKTMTGDILHEQYNEDDTVLGYNTESAFGATTDDSSVDTKSRKSKRKKKGRKAKDTDEAGAKETKKKKKNDCPHCKKFNRRRPHPNILKEKCFWNKKYKGYRPRTVCDELEIKFKPQSKFTAKLGGHTSEDSE